VRIQRVPCVGIINRLRNSSIVMKMAASRVEVYGCVCFVALRDAFTNKLNLRLLRLTLKLKLMEFKCACLATHMNTMKHQSISTAKTWRRKKFGTSQKKTT